MTIAVDGMKHMSNWKRNTPSSYYRPSHVCALLAEVQALVSLEEWLQLKAKKKSMKKQEQKEVDKLSYFYLRGAGTTYWQVDTRIHNHSQEVQNGTD